jgi:NAD(P)-dependent dehydrogenase (short-subunit alcohol dehydrogenase family)
MENKIVLVTGSSDGIGKQTAIELAQKGATVLIHARNADRGRSASTLLSSLVPEGKFDLFIADFSDLDAVRKMAADITKKYSKLDVLINNAGIYCEERVLTNDGNEMTFQVNYLSHFLLTNLLLDALKSAGHARVVNVSSMVHQSARFSFTNLQGEEFYDGYNAYSCSKLENILFTMQLAEILEGENVTVNALHPGVVKTKLLKAAMGSSNMGNPLNEGAATSVYLSSASAVENVSGKYFVNCKPRPPSSFALDSQWQIKLWEVSESLIRF